MGGVKGSAEAKVGYSCEQRALVQGWRKVWSETPGTTDPLGELQKNHKSFDSLPSLPLMNKNNMKTVGMSLHGITAGSVTDMFML